MDKLKGCCVTLGYGNIAVSCRIRLTVSEFLQTGLTGELIGVSFNYPCYYYLKKIVFEYTCDHMR